MEERLATMALLGGRDMDIDFMADAEGVGSKQMVMLPDRDEPVELHWGIPSNNREVAQIGLLRSETARIERPCLIIANEFGLVNGPREKYRASLITTENFFCRSEERRVGNECVHRCRIRRST